jgi:type IV secretory pathway VirB10-like protein
VDEKTKKTLMISAVVTGLVIAAVGGTVAVMSSGEDPKSKAGFETNTPALTQAASQQPGVVSIEPLQVQLQNVEGGGVQGIATVSALFQEFTVGSVQITGGDQRYSFESECLAAGKKLGAGERCNVIVKFNEAGSAGAPSGEQSAEPELLVMGNSKTPGGSIIPIETRAKILPVGADGAFAQGPAGSPLPGGAAPGGLDPYGPVTPAPSAEPAPSAPPVDYTQAPVPPTQQTLSPREQFLLARRQSVLSGARPAGRSQQAQKEDGTWKDLNIPTSTSSYPQDMSRVVTMDRVITAVLERPYDSRSSQQVVAQVDRNVYGAHGRTILIPRGSRIIGTASGGAERVAIQWKQIIRPDGARFIIEASAADAMGQGGVPGRVNQRLMKRYGSILLGTVLGGSTAAIFGAEEESVPSGSNGQQSTARNNGAIITDIVRRDIEKITQDIVQRNQAVQPIITVPAGTRITVIPTMDIQMRPMVGRTEEVRSYPRQQNAGAPAGGYYQGSQGSGGNGGGNSDPKAISFDAPQPNRQQNGTPFPSAEVPAMGSTPPWNSN